MKIITAGPNCTFIGTLTMEKGVGPVLCLDGVPLQLVIAEQCPGAIEPGEVCRLTIEVGVET